MVEENEIRVGLSYYERARIVARAAEQGVYPDEAAALRGLFASASRAKRSKIGSFVAIYHALDDHLQFASAIPERLGLSIAKLVKDDPKAVPSLARALNETPTETSEAELSALTRAVAAMGKGRTKEAVSESETPPKDVIGDIQLKQSRNGTQITLSGRGMSDAFVADLRGWLQSRNA